MMNTQLARSLLALILLATAGAARAAAPDFLVDAEWLEQRSKDPRLVVLEGRYHPHRYYTVGHIPGAINIVSLDGVDGQSQTWKDVGEIAALYGDIAKDKTVYAYCHDGFRSTLAWLQLKTLGYRDVRVYNGGWGDSGNNLTLPAVEGEAPYDEAFAL